MLKTFMEGISNIYYELLNLILPILTLKPTLSKRFDYMLQKRRIFRTHAYVQFPLPLLWGEEFTPKFVKVVLRVKKLIYTQAR